MTVFELKLSSAPSFSELMVERGLNEEARLLGLAASEEIAVFLRDENGQIRGGAQGELLWNWLYVDLVWLDESLRGRGEGRRIMTAIEEGARQQGYPNVWLATTSFQALPFYQATGYSIFGQLEDRPPGHQYYFLQKRDLQPQAATLDIDLDPDPNEVNSLRRGLSDYVRAAGVAVDGKRLAVYLEDDAGMLYGGLVAATYWGWLDIQSLWLGEAVRGRGFAGRMLAMAEAEALKRGCPHAFSDVTSFQAVGFFEHHGYSTFGTLKDRPPGHDTHFMRKALR